MTTAGLPAVEPIDEGGLEIFAGGMIAFSMLDTQPMDPWTPPGRANGETVTLEKHEVR